MAVDHLSLSTTPIVLYRDDVPVSQGTGFYYSHKLQAEDKGQALFLVTNYHVLTGYGPTENKKPIGNNISFQFHTHDSDPSQIKTIRFPLFTTDNKPAWISSSAVPEADLAVLPLPASIYSDCKQVCCISQEWLNSGNMKVRPASDVVLIGYPYGYYDSRNALPVWKKGSVASEPEMNFDGKPLMVIDISAFPGMSGSAAYAVAYGSYETEKNQINIGGARRFLGVYASMQMRKEHKFLEELAHSEKGPGIVHTESLQLGHVWKAQLIVDVINGINLEQYEKDVLQKLP